MSADAAGAGDAESSDAQKSYETILSVQITEALDELRRPADGLFLSGISAGLELGFSILVVLATIALVAEPFGEAVTQLLVANAYTVGFIFVVLGRSELFTEHTTLAVLPVLDRRSTVGKLARLWAIVYGGNIVGGVVFALFAVWVGPSLDLFEPATVVTALEPFTKHGPVALFGGALLAGWLMGLLSWLVAAARETTSRIFFVWLVTAVIGFLHLPHCVAGTIEMTVGLATGAVGPLEVARFIVVATVGNAIGGTIFVALLKYGHVVRGNESDGSVTPAPKE